VFQNPVRASDPGRPRSSPNEPGIASTTSSPFESSRPVACRPYEPEYRSLAPWVNDDLLDGVKFEFDATIESDECIRALYQLDRFTLERDATWFFKVDVEWRMPVWPQWVPAEQPADARLVAKTQTQLNSMTGATITWGNWPGAETSTSRAFPQLPGALRQVSVGAEPSRRSASAR
jgi:hypothetical protein